MSRSYRPTVAAASPADGRVYWGADPSLDTVPEGSYKDIP